MADTIGEKIVKRLGAFVESLEKKETKVRHWKITLTYRMPDKNWTDNSNLGVLADTAEEAMLAVRERGVPKNATDVIIWSVTHCGKIELTTGMYDYLAEMNKR